MNYDEPVSMLALEIVNAEEEIKKCNEYIFSIRRGGHEEYPIEHYREKIDVEKSRIRVFKSAINKLRNC